MNYMSQFIAYLWDLYIFKKILLSLDEGLTKDFY